MTRRLFRLSGFSMLLPIVAGQLSTAWAQPPAERVGAQPPDSASIRMAVRIAPSRDSSDNREVLETLERYFEPTVRIWNERQSLDALSEGFCGHLSREWISRVRELNAVADGAVAPETPLTLPPCPFFSYRGEITVWSNDTVWGTTLRELGHAGRNTLARIATLNSTTIDALDNVSVGDTFRVPYQTVPVSYVLKTAFHGIETEVLQNLADLPSVITADVDSTLSFVNETQPQCELSATRANDHPFDIEAVTSVIERNAGVRKRRRMATIAVIDTGVDEDETRLSFAYGGDDRVGANMDSNYPGFPTTSQAYQNRAHGTHVAGLVLGGLSTARLNGLVQERIQLKIINIVQQDVNRDSLTGAPTKNFSIPLSNVLEAIAYARKDPPTPILNISIETPTRHDSMLNAFASGDYLVVVAAGNRGQDIDLQNSYPASFRSQLPRKFITVGASLPSGQRASFSNYGDSSVDLLAPGCRIPSILPGNQRGSMTGTSQAAPLVAFTAGLLYSEGMDLQAVRNRIRSSVRLAEPPLHTLVATRGVLDIPRALSIYDDLVTTTTEHVPLRGRVHRGTCLQVADECRSPNTIARIAGAVSFETGSQGLVWLRADDGEVVERPTDMPKGTLRFRPHGATQDVHIPFAQVADVLFAVFDSP